MRSVGLPERVRLYLEKSFGFALPSPTWPLHSPMGDGGTRELELLVPESV